MKPYFTNENSTFLKFFDSRIRSANQARRTLPYKPVAANKKHTFLNAFLQQEAVTGNRVMYVHVPFCKTKCNFCIYTKQVAGNEKTIAHWSKAVLKQIESISATKWVQSAPFQAIYFGGGTPTAVPANYLTEIIRTIKKLVPVAPDCEITVESTVSEISPKLCSELKNAGVNRMSLGIQSFNTEIRKNLGRKAGTEDIQKALHTIKESGFNNIAIDLMYMIGGQTMETWKHDLQLLSESPVTGCSVYPLIVKPGSNTAKQPENLEIEYNYFIEADRFLSGLKGWERFTPVQYGHAENGTAKYVTSHGHNPDLLAFGAGAGGRIQNMMYLQSTKLNDFIANGKDFIHAPMVAMQIDPLFLKLRKIFALSEGMYLARADFEGLKEFFDEDVRGLVVCGLVEEAKTHFVLTETGRFWAGNISTLFSERIAKLING